MNVRKPAVAGSFYPSDRAELSRLIDECFLHRLGPGKLPPAAPGSARLVSCVVPHAGYVYSGPVAAHSYLHVSSLPDPEVIVVVAPNHYGIGSGVSSFSSGAWETPLGRLCVDQEGAKKLAKAAGVVAFDPESHRMEHSLEVQLPFLQRLYGDKVPFIPISLAFQDQGTVAEVAKGVEAVLRDRKAVLIASSDFTHYEPADQARRKDLALVNDIESMDLEAFYSTLERLEVTACGFGAIATVIAASKELGFKRGELLKYASSGDTTGDSSQVVGYGAIRFV
ncbi:MAG TPA: AmmeMemoRadiSam system protein B [Nitrososphaerales archaeon]|nr:AmmeMemoRadiSam system protein B [Nitrososphaerales archaeon]